jgi:hypothetical protein
VNGSNNEHANTPVPRHQALANPSMSASTSNNKHNAGRVFAPGIDEIFHYNGQRRALILSARCRPFFVL